MEPAVQKQLYLTSSHSYLVTYLIDFLQILLWSIVSNLHFQFVSYELYIYLFIQICHWKIIYLFFVIYQKYTFCCKLYHSSTGLFLIFVKVLPIIQYISCTVICCQNKYLCISMSKPNLNFQWVLNIQILFLKIQRYLSEDAHIQWKKFILLLIFFIEKWDYQKIKICKQFLLWIRYSSNPTPQK